MKNVIFVSVVLLTSVFHCKAQIFIGVGFADTRLGKNAFDNAAGFSLMVEKDFNLSKSTRWKIHPNVHMSFLYSDAYRAFEPLYLNIITISPKVSYEVISSKKVKVAPYANPFFSMLVGLRSGNSFFLLEPIPINEFKGGIESGLRVDIVIHKTTIRAIPIAVQFGKSFYKQGMISLLFSL